MMVTMLQNPDRAEQASKRHGDLLMIRLVALRQVALGVAEGDRTYTAERASVAAEDPHHSVAIALWQGGSGTPRYVEGRLAERFRSSLTR